MTSRKALAAVSALALVAMSASAHAANLVQNGGFETTTTGVSSEFGSQYPSQQVANWTSNAYSWVFTPGTADLAVPVANGIDGALSLWGPNNGAANGLTGSPDGGNFIAVDPSYRTGTVEQVIGGLHSGSVYTLTFYYAAAQQYFFDGETTEGWDVSLGGETHSTSTISLPNHGFSGWNLASMQFTATGASETLKFLATGGPSSSQPPFSLLDGVSLTGGVPEPASWGLMIVGFGGIGAAMRRRRSAVATA